VIRDTDHAFPKFARLIHRFGDATFADQALTAGTRLRALGFAA
jgi:hypothetical protein